MLNEAVWIFFSSHVTELFEPLLFNLSSYRDGGSEVKLSDQLEVGQGCQSSLNYLYPPAHAHTHTHITPHHVVIKCRVQSSSARCKPVVVISVGGLWTMVLGLHISASLSGNQLDHFIPQAETQTLRGKQHDWPRLLLCSANKRTIVGKSYVSLQHEPRMSKSDVTCADSSYITVVLYPVHWEFSTLIGCEVWMSFYSITRHRCGCIKLNR